MNCWNPEPSKVITVKEAQQTITIFANNLHDKLFLRTKRHLVSVWAKKMKTVSILLIHNKYISLYIYTAY